MNLLAIDVGSSSVKMGLLRDGRIVHGPVRQTFPTNYSEQRAEVDPQAIMTAIFRAARQINSKKVDCIAIATMAPSWVAMDRKGKALTPVVTHQDRRSVKIAQEIENRVGKKRILHLAGNRPFPGGISSTTCAWFLRHQKSLMKRADLVGHFQTYFHRQVCGSRMADPSHASFMGVYSTLTLGGWNEELCDAIGLSQKLLPEVRESNRLAGKLLPEAARHFGLSAGVPVLTGMIDTGAAMLLAGAKVGQMVNVSGTTDVLALCTDRPKPHERLLTRALGVGKRWVSVGTIAAAGSSLNWAKDQFFADMTDKQFFKLAKAPGSAAGVEFAPYLAGDRMSIEQRLAAFTNLSLSTTRNQLLAAIIDALAKVSAERIQLLRWTGTKILRNVMISGGGGGELAKIMHRDWPGTWKFWSQEEATMRGLAKLKE